MKKLTITLFVCLIAAFAFSQTPAKQDTTIQITLKISEYRALLGAIDANVDSKKAAAEIFKFIQEKAQIVQPADKPKEATKKKE